MPDVLFFILRIILYGVGAIGMAKLIVFAMGFESIGVRKRSVAAFFIRRHNGQIPKDGWLSHFQAIGAGGLGYPLCGTLFVLGSAISLLTKRYC
jgi:hypothetical protein